MKLIYVSYCAMTLVLSQGVFAQDRPVHYRWQDTDDSRVACYEYSSISNRRLKSVSDALCTRRKPVHYLWQDTNDSRVACYEYSSISNRRLTSVSDALCTRPKPVFYRWADSNLNGVACYEYSRISNRRLTSVSESHCRRRVSQDLGVVPGIIPASVDPRINSSERDVIPKSEGAGDGDSSGPRGARAVEA